MLLSAVAGLLSLVLAPWSLSFSLGNTIISIPWPLLLPVLAAAAFGPRNGMVAGICGGSWFPFLLWSYNGWANLVTAAVFTFYFIGVGRLAIYRIHLKSRVVYRRMAGLLLIFIPVIAVAYLILYPYILQFNPPPWTADVRTSIATATLLNFLIKDVLNLLLLTIIAETLLRLDPLRKLTGARRIEPMRRNLQLLGWALVIGIAFWGLFVLLDASLIRSPTLYRRPYIPLALLLVLACSVVVARVLMSFSEKMLITNAALRGSERQLQVAVHEKEVLIRELYHRTKNNMQTIISIISLKTSDSSNEEVLRLFRDIENQISAMSLVHTQLYQSNSLTHIDLESYLQNLFSLIAESFEREHSLRLDLRCNAISLPLTSAIPCGLILNELITNTCKYAFPRHQSGCITIEVERSADNQLRLLYGDNGVGMPSHDTPPAGIGLSTVYALAEGQLGGKITILDRPGVWYHIIWPG